MKRQAHPSVGLSILRWREAGVSMTECLIALPLLLVLGLGSWQWILVLQARQLIEHAAYEAVRSGSVGHASASSIDEGLAQGLSAYWIVGTAREPSARRSHAAERLEEARRDGVLEWRQLAPTRSSFLDWAEPAIDPKGQPIETLREIPVDNLDARIARTRPASGVAGWLGAEPIGQSSGQTLRDALVLRIEVQVAVPLRIPVAGWLLAGVARAVGACSEPCLVDPGASGSTAAVGRPHLPIRVHAEIRMQSAVRLSARTPDRRQSVSATTPTTDGRRPLDWAESERAGRDLAVQSTGGSSPPAESAPAADLPAVPATVAEAVGVGGAAPPAQTLPREGEIWTPGACGISPG